MRTALIVLASGYGKRFGSNKLMYEINNKPMFRNITDILLKLLIESPKKYEVIIITSHNELINELDSDKDINNFKIIYNCNPQKGQSESVKLGIEGAKDCDKYGLFVADQPYLTKESIEILLDKSKEFDIAAFCKGGKPVNPVIFDNKYRDELLSISGDKGAREVLHRHLEDIGFVYAKEKELEDIDTP